MDFAALNGLDYTVLAIITISTLFALFRGFIQTFLSFTGWILAAVITFYSLPYVKPLLAQKIQNDLIVDITATIGVYLIALILIAIINYRILYITREVRGGPVDMSLGFAFGLVRGAALSCVLFLILTLISPLFESKEEKPAADKATEKAASKDQPQAEKKGLPWVYNAKTYNLLKSGSDAIVAVLPDHFQKMITAASTKAENNAVTKMYHIPRALSFQDTETLQQLVESLPKTMRPGSKTITAEQASKDIALVQNADFLRAIIASYREAVHAGRIPDHKRVSEERIKALEATLSKAAFTGMSQPLSKTNASHYDKKQLNDIDRLMQTLH